MKFRVDLLFSSRFMSRFSRRTDSPQNQFLKQSFRRGFAALSLILIGLVGSFLLKGELLGIASARAASPPVSEIRGVWLTNVDSEVMFSPDRLDNALQTLRQMNFNTVYPTVWNWGYTLYPSPIAQQASGVAIDPRVPALQDWQMLSDLIQKGHQQGLTVIPWFEFGFMITAESEIALRHLDWITNRRNGSQIWQDGIYQRRWLNPFKPEVQQFILGLILEIVTHYNVDGIQFDDHLGLPDDFGYDAYTVQLYRREHQGKLPPASPQDPEWVKWRADKITAFMRTVFQAVKARKPNVLVSLSPNSYPFAYRHFLQDWRNWERSGLIEELIVQIYQGNSQRFLAELSRPEVQAARQHIPTAIGLLTGLKDTPVPIRQVQQQAIWTRDRRFAGISLFFYESLWNLSRERPQDRQAVLRSIMAGQVRRPSVLDKGGND
ncbi:glycoside hydrolase family 10 protein [Leptolyngbya sp. FACHB-711]|uniref:glycoside hydrolase family 10 protein n=1 Tax=Leptolyngbya sp. FACHB-711 TaxID=2692813 RepID=UPI0018EFF38F|nr:glycoside hydrolase family 10 protein [Leptolyngbya sp. FACHB-711]